MQVTIDRRLASGTGESSIAYMDKATTLVQSAHGLVAVAIATAVLPALAAANARVDLTGFRRTLGASLRLSLLLIVPLALGLFVLAEPLIALFFQHGAFSAQDTFWTSAALRLYLLGLIFATIDWPLNYAFYARQDTLTPALVGVFSVAVYLGVALWLVRPLGMLGLVLADSAKHFAHALTMLFLTERRMGGLRGQNLLGALARIVPAALLMGAAIWGVRAGLAALGSERLLARLAVVALSGGVGAALYGGLMLWRGPEEARMLYETVRRKVRRMP
jgi:putative peptidoglycan lipid II flippase